MAVQPEVLAGADNDYRLDGQGAGGISLEHAVIIRVCGGHGEHVDQAGDLGVLPEDA